MDTAASVAAIRLDRCLPAALQVFCNGKRLSFDDFHLCFPTKSRSSAVILFGGHKTQRRDISRVDKVEFTSFFFLLYLQ